MRTRKSVAKSEQSVAETNGCGHENEVNGVTNGVNGSLHNGRSSQTRVGQATPANWGRAW